MINTFSDLVEAVETAWSNLEAFFSTLTEDQMAMQDGQGWTISDHIMHMAVWEDSVTFLFRGKPRHEALGVNEAYYLQASFDEINEKIRQDKGSMPTDEAMEQLRQAHSNLMAHVTNLSEPDLDKTVRDFFPKAPRSDERRVIDFIYQNTGGHFLEHLEWMRTLVGEAA